MIRRMYQSAGRRVHLLRLRPCRNYLTHGSRGRLYAIVEHRNHCVCASCGSHPRSLVIVCIFCTSQHAPLSILARQVIIEHTPSPCHRRSSLGTACLYSYLLSSDSLVHAIHTTSLRICSPTRPIPPRTPLLSGIPTKFIHSASPAPHTPSLSALC